MKRIDGVEVNPADRDTAEGAYVDQVLRFNEKIEQVRAEHTALGVWLVRSPG